MYEMMIDLETLDTKNSAVVLSIGAVVWRTHTEIHEDMANQKMVTRLGGYEIIDSFLDVLGIDEQIARSRTVSQDTLRWWMEQSPEAKNEAFRGNRTPPPEAMENLCDFVHKFKDVHGLNACWASPATFDFPIWEDLALTFHSHVPWTYRQKYDVRTVVKEASYSAADHILTRTIGGVPHTPLYDCEWQIDLLHAARVKMGRRIGEK